MNDKIIARGDDVASHSFHTGERANLSVRAFRSGCTVLSIDTGATVSVQLPEEDAEAFAHQILNAINNARQIRALEMHEAKAANPCVQVLEVANAR